MDEVTLFKTVRPAAPEFTEADRQAARDRVLAAAAGESLERRRAIEPGLWSAASITGGQRTGGWRPGGRRLAGLRRPWAATAAAAAVVVVAAGATAVLLTGPVSHTGGTVQPGQAGHAPAAATRPASPASPPATASAVLLLAAHAAATTPGLRPRPGQFVYTQQLVVGEDYLQVSATGGSRLVRTPPYLERDWLSADGRHDMFRSQRNLPDGKWFTSLGKTSLCDPAPLQRICHPGYVTRLPRTAGGMRDFLLSSGGPNGPAAYRILNGISNWSWETGLLVPNHSYALMFRAAAQVKGIYLVHRAVNVAGRTGVAVAACVPAGIDKGSMTSFHGCPERTELIFDARTYELIGEYHVAAKGQPPLPGNPSTGLLRTAVVNRLGQLP
jgi:hypothetical protein